MQGPAAGGEARAEASVGAAQTGAAQGGGDGTTAALRPGDGASQEAAEARGGQGEETAANTDISVKFTVKLRYRRQNSACLGYDADPVQIYRQLFRL